jgi:CheY-like chemotaxis protein
MRKRPYYGPCFFDRSDICVARGVSFIADRIPAPMNSGTQAKLILIVEDHAATAELVAECVNEEPGCRALIAGDAHTALELIRTDPPDLILLDVRLPDVDGFELYDIFRADPAASDIPVIFISASASTAIAAHLERRHIESYIAKPFEVDYLLSRIREVVRPTAP